MDPLIDSLRRAIEAAPDDVPLRVHLVRILLERGHVDEARAQAGAAIALAPADPAAHAAMTAALAAGAAEPADGAQDARSEAADSAGTAGFDWHAAEDDVKDVADPLTSADPSGIDVERPVVTLADVGGLEEVKERLDAAFLAPLRNPELQRLYGKRVRGGLLMYGPPGCGKTYIARALAGELGARFLSVGIADVLDPFAGVSEQNIRRAFALARQSSPCVLFLDEIDALGQKRSLARNSTTMRNVVNQLLVEMDGFDANDGVYVLAATNQPWDVDPALRRPGRFDRTVLVLPPDEAAREAIFRSALEGRPLEGGIDFAKLAKLTAGFSGADIAGACEHATENALLASVRSGVARPVGSEDLVVAIRATTPSTGPWLDSARNVVQFGVDDGTFVQLRAYLKSAKRS
ncbi:ATP-binding protein [Microbacterium sp. ASV49]|uniref:ATP-binding protein n=1 Tax=Microbacterium candidum TaxID=3041922 RepID=A0ABT7N1T1_9MICO|nr:ATP-binding protein [Microbacterium sp. ASV49]MDL9980665.1 ATP-binding protein [Microbacterium sp. ASV49]